MYEIAAFIRATNPAKKKVRKVPIKTIRPGANVILRGSTLAVVAERDARYKNAWFLNDAEGNRLPYSFSRGEIQVQ